jgi:hypothetical protein
MGVICIVEIKSLDYLQYAAQLRFLVELNFSKTISWERNFFHK